MMKQVDVGVGDQGGLSSVPQPQGRLGLPRTLSKSHSSRLNGRGMESLGWLWTLSSGMSEETDIPGASQALKQLHSDMRASLRCSVSPTRVWCLSDKSNSNPSSD